MINEDCYDDILIGKTCTSGCESHAGESFVLYGSSNPVNYDLATDSLDIDEGLYITSATINYFGASVSGVGDFNGDGLPI